MTCAGTRARERFFENMQAVAVGAKLARRSVEWTVVKAVRRETSIDLTLRSGHREFVASVMVSHYGPDLHWADLHPVANAPAQRELQGMAA
ncbi:MAG TPA: hypothetical protein VGF12_01020 [Roseateles sp.]|uniref:hypothetical protein n=1 Tax=Roseateles sp. TaxID=1971397 RepID=UPI002ED7F8C6